jgi:hypothetical protein
MAKKTVKKSKKTAKKSAEPRELKAGDYVIPRARIGCTVKVGAVEFVIPRGKDGCKVTVE